MSEKWILDEGKLPVPVDDLMAWGRWMQSADRQVDRTEILGRGEVSTVFLGLDHNIGSGPPLLFETMVFGGPLDGEQERCSTWLEAVRQHNKMVKRLKELK